MSFRRRWFPTSIGHDLAALVVGKKLGRGGFRRVHEWLPDESLVVKFEEGAGSFANAMEWETWHRAKGTPLERWLAPCVEISPCGMILLQKRTDCDGSTPKQVPTILKDRKWANWGRYKGRLVCHDYGYIEFHKTPMPPVVLEPWE